MSKSKKAMANMIDLFEIQKYDTKNSCFGLKGGKYLDLVRVICTDFQSIREMDLEYENLKMEQFYSRYPSDLKLVCVNMPERCTEQLGFISHKLENCQHEWRRSALKARKMELEWLEKNRQRKRILPVFVCRFRGAVGRCKRRSRCPFGGCQTGYDNFQSGKNRSAN